MTFSKITPRLRRISYRKEMPITQEAIFSVMGESLLFQSNSEKLFSSAQEAFGRFPAVAQTSRPPLILQLFEQDDNHHPVKEQDALEFNWYTYGHLLHLNTGGQNSIVIDLKEGFAVGHISAQLASNSTAVRHMFIEMAAQTMLGFGRQFVPIHAACLIKDEQVLLLHGRSGIGKSTLTYACLRHGYTLLAEDIVQVKIRKEGLQFWGIPWRLHLLPDTIRFFPELENHQAIRINNEWKIPILVEEQFPQAAICCASPGVFVFLERTDQAKASFRQLPDEEALARFEVIWNFDEAWPSGFDEPLQQLVHGSYQLNLAENPDDSVAGLDALVDEITKQSS